MGTYKPVHDIALYETCIYRFHKHDAFQKAIPGWPEVGLTQNIHRPKPCVCGPRESACIKLHFSSEHTQKQRLEPGKRQELQAA